MESDRKCTPCAPDVMATSTRSLTRTLVRVGRAVVRVDGRTVVVERDGDDPLDLLRAACLAIWECGTAIHALEVPERLYR